MSDTTQWSRHWKASTDPSKQRKYRRNAPKHRQKQFLNAHLAESVRDTVDTRAVPVVTGDKVEVMRGDFAGEEGRVDDIDTEEKVVYVDGIEREAVDGSDAAVALRPSNLKITKLNLEDDLRLAKYEVSEEEKDEISVEPEEEAPEEDVEAGEDAAEGDEVEEEATEEETEEEEAAVDDEAAGEADESVAEAEEPDYAELVDGTVDDVKDAVRDGDIDPEKVLDAEQAGKNRVTLVEWLESRVEGDADE